MRDFEGFTKEQRQYAKEHGLPLVRIIIDARHIGRGGVDAKHPIPAEKLGEVFAMWNQIARMMVDYA